MLIYFASKMRLFTECIHIGNSPYFFVELMLTPSNLSDIRTYFIKLFRPIDVPKEVSINSVMKQQNDLNLILIQCMEKGFTNHNISCKCRNVLDVFETLFITSFITAKLKHVTKPFKSIVIRMVI